MSNGNTSLLSPLPTSSPFLFLPIPIKIPVTTRPTSLHNQPDTTAGRTNGTNVAHLAHGALVLGVILCAVKRTSDALLAGVDGGKRRGANVEFGKAVEFYLDGVAGLALADCFYFFGLLRRGDMLAKQFFF